MALSAIKSIFVIGLICLPASIGIYKK